MKLKDVIVHANYHVTNKTSYCKLPYWLSSQLSPSKSEVFKIQFQDKFCLYLLWNGGITASQSIEIFYQSNLKLNQSEYVILSTINVIYDVTEISIEPCKASDWDIVSTQANKVEDIFLQQHNLVYISQQLSIALSPSLITSFLVTSLKSTNGDVPTIDKDNEICIGKLSTNSLLLVAPYVSTSVNNNSINKKLSSVEEEEKKEVKADKYIISLRVLPEVFKHMNTSYKLNIPTNDSYRVDSEVRSGLCQSAEAETSDDGLDSMLNVYESMYDPTDKFTTNNNPSSSLNNTTTSNLTSKNQHASKNGFGPSEHACYIHSSWVDPVAHSTNSRHMKQIKKLYKTIKYTKQPFYIGILLLNHSGSINLSLDIHHTTSTTTSTPLRFVQVYVTDSIRYDSIYIPLHIRRYYLISEYEHIRIHLLSQSETMDYYSPFYTASEISMLPVNWSFTPLPSSTSFSIVVPPVGVSGMHSGSTAGGGGGDKTRSLSIQSSSTTSTSTTTNSVPAKDSDPHHHHQHRSPSASASVTPTQTPPYIQSPTASKDAPTIDTANDNKDDSPSKATYQHYNDDPGPKPNLRRENAMIHISDSIGFNLNRISALISSKFALNSPVNKTSQEPTSPTVSYTPVHDEHTTTPTNTNLHRIHTPTSHNTAYTHPNNTNTHTNNTNIKDTTSHSRRSSIASATHSASHPFSTLPLKGSKWPESLIFSSLMQLIEKEECIMLCSTGTIITLQGSSVLHTQPPVQQEKGHNYDPLPIFSSLSYSPTTHIHSPDSVNYYREKRDFYITFNSNNHDTTDSNSNNNNNSERIIFMNMNTLSSLPKITVESPIPLEVSAKYAYNNTDLTRLENLTYETTLETKLKQYYNQYDIIHDILSYILPCILPSAIQHRLNFNILPVTCVLVTGNQLTGKTTILNTITNIIKNNKNICINIQYFDGKKYIHYTLTKLITTLTLLYEQAELYSPTIICIDNIDILFPSFDLENAVQSGHNSDLKSNILSLHFIRLLQRNQCNIYTSHIHAMKLYNRTSINQHPSTSSSYAISTSMKNMVLSLASAKSIQYIHNALLNSNNNIKIVECKILPLTLNQRIKLFSNVLEASKISLDEKLTIPVSGSNLGQYTQGMYICVCV